MSCGYPPVSRLRRERQDAAPREVSRPARYPSPAVLDEGEAVNLDHGLPGLKAVRRDHPGD